MNTREATPSIVFLFRCGHLEEGSDDIFNGKLMKAGWVKGNPNVNPRGMGKLPG